MKVQIDGIGVGLELAAATFLPIFLTRLGATNFQIGLLTAMPAIAGFFLSLAAGRFLQSRRNVVPWHSGTRLLYVSSYALIGLSAFLVPQQSFVPIALAIRITATLSLPLLAVAHTVLMNAVAGSEGRYALMSRRWSAMGLTSAIVILAVGQVLERFRFPINYQWVLIVLSTGGLISYVSSIRIEIPDTEPQPRTTDQSLMRRLDQGIALILRERAFVSFVGKQFVYLLGSSLALPLFPLYYVREVQATDAWIGIISSAQTAVTLVGYFFWTRQRQARGSRFVLLCTTLGLATYPVLVASTLRVQWIAFYAGLAGILYAGLNLVFFDELMKTVPAQYSPTFVSVALTSQYLAAAVAPLMGTSVANHVGLANTLRLSALISLVAFGLFAYRKTDATQ